MVGELIEKYVIERIESLEEELQDCLKAMEYNGRQWDALNKDMLTVLGMINIDYDKKILDLDIWEKHEREQYDELKRILNYYGMWKEEEDCEQDTRDFTTSPEIAATSEG